MSRAPLALTTLAAVLASCSTEPMSTAPDTTTFEKFKATVYIEPGTGMYIVDGDTPLESEEQLRAFYDELVGSRASMAPLVSPLIVNRVNNSDDRWSSANDLTYCVSADFGTNYAAVVEAMGMAANAWSGTWDVGFVNFRHRADQDGNCNASNTNVVFDVRMTSGQSYLARAFFPSYRRANRNILIDASSFGNIAPYTLTGILRHELGHTLGLRHEHTRPEAGTCFEDSSWRALTPYDSASVMHYPQCNGTNKGDLVLTHVDRDGELALYGTKPDYVIDAVYYLGLYGDLQSAFGPNNFSAATNHWNTYGQREGRRSAPWFDVQYYLAKYGDLQAAFGANNWPAAAHHWVTYGLNEGRVASVGFDVAYYLGHYPDLQAAFGPTNYRAALEHFVRYGAWEGRRSAPGFDVAYYLASYPDLQAAFGPRNYRAAWYHWVTYGYNEGRRGAP